MKRKVRRPGAKGKAWTVFSRYIRLRDALITTGTLEYAECFTCGKVFPIKDMDAGHWISRGHLGTFMDERNVNAQCRGCNRFGRGRPVEYQQHLLSLYGSDILECLTRQAQTRVKIRERDWMELEMDYRERIKVLEEYEAVPKEWADVFLAYVAAAVR